MIFTAALKRQPGMVRLTLPGKPEPTLARSHAGFAYVALLLVIAVVALGLGIATEQVEHSSQREREEQLLFVGSQFRKAIASYYEQSPGAKQYPRKLEELLKDNRFPKAKRHLRRIYPDPMSKRADWQLVRNPQGSIIGVSSRSELTPIRTKLDDDLMQANGDTPILHYSDWKFVYQPADGSADLVKPAGAGSNVLSDPDNPFGQVESEGETEQQDESDTSQQ